MADPNEPTIVELSARIGMSNEEESWVLHTAAEIISRVVSPPVFGLKLASDADQIVIRVLTEQMASFPGRVPQ